MVFQSYALYPHMTVADNMAFSLKLRKADAVSRSGARAKAAKILNLEPYLARFRASCPAGSGSASRWGARSCATRRCSCSTSRCRISTPSCVSRCAPRSRRCTSGCKTTTVYVTHDQVEAMTMADRIVVMHDGRIEQIGTPLELYDRPDNLFVAQFIGSPAMNIVSGTVRRANGGAWVEVCRGVRWPLWTHRGRRRPGSCVRRAAGHLSLGGGGAGAGGNHRGRADRSRDRASGAGRRSADRAGHARASDRQSGRQDRLAVDPAMVHVFDQKTGARIAALIFRPRDSGPGTVLAPPECREDASPPSSGPSAIRPGRWRSSSACCAVSDRALG